MDFKLNTGLESYIYIDNILYFDSQSIITDKNFQHAEGYELIETMAQTGAMHYRKTIEFSKQVFLLKIENSDYLNDKVNRCLTVVAHQIGKSSTSAKYKIIIKDSSHVIMSSIMLFSTVEYDKKFDKNTLINHYRNLFECSKLKSG